MHFTDSCEQEIQLERNLHEELEKETKEWEKKVKDRRMGVTGNEATRCVAQHMQKKKSILEGRLHRVNIKYLYYKQYEILDDYQITSKSSH